MLEFDARKMMNAASAVTATADRAVVPAERPRKLSPAALKVAALPTNTAYSPIVLAGAVRMIEFALIALVGLVVYLAYVVPIDGFEWHYVVAIFGHRRAGDARLPGRRHLSGAGIPRLREAVFPPRLRLVGRVPDRDRRLLLRQDRRSVLARLAGQLLRRRPRRADRLSARACSSWCGAGRAKAASTAAPSSSAATTAARR